MLQWHIDIFLNCRLLLSADQIPSISSASTQRKRSSQTRAPSETAYLTYTNTSMPGEEFNTCNVRSVLLYDKLVTVGRSVLMVVYVRDRHIPLSISHFPSTTIIQHIIIPSHLVIVTSLRLHFNNARSLTSKLTNYMNDLLLVISVLLFTNVDLDLRQEYGWQHMFPS